MVDFLEHGLSYHVAQELNDDSSSDDEIGIHTRLERAFLMADIHARQLGVMASGATAAVCLVSVSTAYSSMLPLPLWLEMDMESRIV